MTVSGLIRWTVGEEDASETAFQPRSRCLLG